jgi:hypothetical protein
MKKAGVHLAHEDAIQLEREVNDIFQVCERDREMEREIERERERERE